MVRSTDHFIDVKDRAFQTLNLSKFECFKQEDSPVDRRNRCASDQIEDQRGYQTGEQNDDRPESCDLVLS